MPPRVRKCVRGNKSTRLPTRYASSVCGHYRPKTNQGRLHVVCDLLGQHVGPTANRIQSPQFGSAISLPRSASTSAFPSPPIWFSFNFRNSARKILAPPQVVHPSFTQTFSVAAHRTKSVNEGFMLHQYHITIIEAAGRVEVCAASEKRYAKSSFIAPTNRFSPDQSVRCTPYGSAHIG